MDAMAENLIHPQPTYVTSSPQVVAPTSKTCQPNINMINFDAMAQNLTHLQPTYVTSTPQVVEEATTLQFLSSENAESLLTNQSQILNKLNLILDNQVRFGQKLASLSVQLNETNEKFSQFQMEQQCNVTLLQNASQEERESFSLKPIETSEEFEILELNLADKMYRKRLIRSLSTLYSTKPGEGQTCAYKLIDVLFTKEFLCQCSWSGGSKGEHSKIAMKDFKRFRKFFFDIIFKWDSTFSEEKMTKFFKIVLRNANKRKFMQGKRESTKRTRKPKNSREQVGNEANVAESNDNNESRMDENNDEEPIPEENYNGREQRNENGDGDREGNDNDDFRMDENNDEQPIPE